MNKKILIAFTSFLILAMMLTPLALASSWDPKNNDKFQTFSTILVPNVANIATAAANPEYIPSQDNPNKVITSWVEEPMIDYEITVGTNTYYLGVDFEYTGVAVLTAIGAPFTANPPFGLIVGSKQRKFRVDYKYDFDAIPGGIEGTLEMLAITAKDGVMHIRNLKGTGDLQNVKIQATGIEVGLGHIGVVLGWPE